MFDLLSFIGVTSTSVPAMAAVMTRMMGSSELSPSLWAIANWGEWLIHWRAGLLCRWTWSDWKNELSGTSWSSADTEPCTWADTTLCGRTGWELSREQLSRRHRGHSRQVNCVALQARVQLHAGLSRANRFGRKSFFPSIWHPWDYIWNTIYSFGLVEDTCSSTKTRLAKATGGLREREVDGDGFG